MDCYPLDLLVVFSACFKSVKNVGSYTQALMKKKRSKKVKRYPTDLNDKRWEIIRVLLLEALLNGRPRTIYLRKLINAIL